MVPSSHVITPNRDDVIESRLRLRYSTTCDTYYRDWSDSISLASKNVYPGWERGVFALDSVLRKVDEESGQVYFDRIKGSSTGFIKWQFDFSHCGLLVDDVTLRINYTEGYGGEITTTLVGNAGNTRLRYLKGGEYETYSELQNSSVVTITIHVIGEQDQVTKLFPQRIMGGMGYPLDVQIKLKPPLESLGRPRVLVGLMYSNAQEMEVDLRHYKDTGISQRVRGFLHIHLHHARDLPSARNKTLDVAAKCYVLPDCKKGKCKTRTRKGKDPHWNEEFLIVGVDFLKMRRQALEICFVDNHNKKGFVGGLRLSLGHQIVMAEQAKRAASVLKAFGSKRENTKDTPQTAQTNADANSGQVKTNSDTNRSNRTVNPDIRVNGDVGRNIEVQQRPNLQAELQDITAVNPSLSIGQIWNVTSMEELRALDTRSLHGAPSQRASVDGIAMSNGSRDTPRASSSVSTLDSRSLRGVSSQRASVDGLTMPNDSSRSTLRALSTVSIHSSMSTSQRYFTSLVRNHTSMQQSVANHEVSRNNAAAYEERRREQSLVREVWFTSVVHTNGGVNIKLDNGASDAPTPSPVSRRESVDTGSKCDGAQGLPDVDLPDGDVVRQTTADDTVKTKDVNDNPDKPREKRRSSASCMGLSKRWGLISERRHSETSRKKDQGNGVERELLDKMLLDAVGLEVTQWENMVNKPKQWHYCWQILRKDMIPVHHQYNTTETQNPR